MHGISGRNSFLRRGECKTRENSNFLKKGKIVILVKIRNFSRFQMTKRTSPLKMRMEEKEEEGFPGFRAVDVRKFEY